MLAIGRGRVAEPRSPRPPDGRLRPSDRPREPALGAARTRPDAAAAGLPTSAPTNTTAISRQASARARRASRLTPSTPSCSAQRARTPQRNSDRMRPRSSCASVGSPRTTSGTPLGPPWEDRPVEDEVDTRVVAAQVDQSITADGAPSSTRRCLQVEVAVHDRGGLGRSPAWPPRRRCRAPLQVRSTGRLARVGRTARASSAPGWSCRPAESDRPAARRRCPASGGLAGTRRGTAQCDPSVVVHRQVRQLSAGQERTP